MSTEPAKPTYRQLLLATLFAVLILLPVDAAWTWGTSLIDLAWYCWLPIGVVYAWVNLKILQTAYAKWAGTEVRTWALFWNFVAAAILAAVFSYLIMWPIHNMAGWDMSAPIPGIILWVLEEALLVPILAKLIKFEGRQQPATRPLADYWHPFYTRKDQKVVDAPADPLDNPKDDEQSKED